MTEKQQPGSLSYQWRQRFVLGVIMIGMTSLIVRATWLQFNQDPRLIRQLERQQHEIVRQAVARGRILDRHGEILASSAPIRSVGIDRQLFQVNAQSVSMLGKTLGIPLRTLRKTLNQHKTSRYLPIKRRVSPSKSRQVASLGLDGIVIDHRYDRYYPAGESSAQVIGFVDGSGHGKAGAEQIFDDQLYSTAGAYSVIRDRMRHKLESIKQVKQPESGSDIMLSIDQRLQYSAYKELKAAMQQHRAKAASFVMLDVDSGEILAMANLPEFNPNDKTDRNPAHYRNRAVTDLFEPGSTIKPFTIACALQAGMITPETEFDTSPGYLRVGRHIVRDTHNYKLLNISGVLRKSSNIGVTKIALALQPQILWDCFHRAQLDLKTSIRFPGTVAGHLPDYHGWGQFEQATHAFGYGLNTSLLQLAHAYTAIANQGIAPNLSLLKQAQSSANTQVFEARTAEQILSMMETVVSSSGTASRAQIPGYRIAGKTGTVQKITSQGYSRDHHLALFVGIAPASHPRFVAAVLVDDPQQGGYYGGVVAAPVFANVMKQALRLYAVSPDKQSDEVHRLPVPSLLAANDDYIKKAVK